MKSIPLYPIILFPFLLIFVTGCEKGNDSPLKSNSNDSLAILTGDTSLCLPTRPATYCLENIDTAAISYSWNISPSDGVVFSGQGTSCITVSSWGNAVEYILSVTWQHPDTTINAGFLTKVVHAYPDLSKFDYGVSFSTNGPYYSNVTCFAFDSTKAFPGGVRQKWEIYEAFNSEPLNYQTIGPVLRFAEDTIPFIVNTPEPGQPNLYEGKPYVIIRTLWYENQQCTGAEIRHKFWSCK
ncbi:MAG: hypothetical protein HXX13_02555 [Bacteroidetes bacterium]|nr:hypothetical protein [Bacteroidota bacterium]